jgi:tetratricopeptide (TPR) repeat protein
MPKLVEPWRRGATLLALLLCHALSPADESLRREVAQPLQAAQEALKARHPEEALGLLSPVRGLKDLTAVEQGLVGRLVAVAAMQARQFPLAVEVLEPLVQRAELPEPERKQLLQSLVNASVNLKDYERAARWARVGFELGGPEAARFHLVLLQALNLSGRHAEVLEAMRGRAAQAETPEAEWRVLGASQLALKDEAGYYQTLLALLKVAPSKDYWADLLPRVSQQPGFNPRMELEVYRLYEATGNLEDAADFNTMAQLAMKAGLPAEASRVLNDGMGRKLLGGAGVQSLLAQARQRAGEDEQSMSAQRQSARTGDDWAQLGDLYASALKWSEAVQAYAQARSLGGLKRADEVGLHYGRSLWGAGDKPQALSVLTQVGGDAAALARLWGLLVAASP